MDSLWNRARLLPYCITYLTVNIWQLSLRCRQEQTNIYREKKKKKNNNAKVQPSNKPILLLP